MEISTPNHYSRKKVRRDMDFIVWLEGRRGRRGVGRGGTEIGVAT